MSALLEIGFGEYIAKIAGNPKTTYLVTRERMSPQFFWSYTLIPLSMYWKDGRAKVEIGLARGKKEHDKREATAARDWQRDKARLMKDHS